MSVVPLLAENDLTVVTTIEAFEQAGGTNGSAVLIRDMDLEQLTGQSSNASYDLRVGKEYRDHRDIGKHDLPENEKIILHPGTAVIIETEEFVHLPRNRFAFVVPKVGLLQKGLSNTMSKVDPGYQGYLLVTLFNLGKARVTLNRRDSFCSLCVLQVEEGATLYGRQGKRIEGQAKRRWLQSKRDALERNGPALTATLILTTVALILLEVLQIVF